MPSRIPPARYGAVAQAFHWIIAALVVTQFVLANLEVDLPIGAHKLALLARHKSVGMTILMLAVLRLLWRLWNPPPALPVGMNPSSVPLPGQPLHILCAAVRHAGHRLDDVVGQELFGQLVRIVHLAQSHRRERGSLPSASHHA